MKTEYLASVLNRINETKPDVQALQFMSMYCEVAREIPEARPRCYTYYLAPDPDTPGSFIGILYDMGRHNLHVYVLPEHRRKGIMGLLISEFMWYSGSYSTHQYFTIGFEVRNVFSLGSFKQMRKRKGCVLYGAPLNKNPLPKIYAERDYNNIYLKD